MSTEHYIILTIILKEEDDGRWTAECKELGTATFGDTFEETRENIKEAVLLHLNALRKVGERERFFRENGIKIKTRPQKTISVSVPLNDPHVFVQSYAQPVHPGVC